MKEDIKNHILCNFIYMLYLEKANLESGLISDYLGLEVGTDVTANGHKESSEVKEMF